MKTYLVRTIEDEVLIGVFCARTMSVLKQLILPMVEPEDCEYLVLGDKEGLFVEAQFLTIPAELTGGKKKVYLTNEPESFCQESLDAGELSQGLAKRVIGSRQAGQADDTTEPYQLEKAVSQALGEALEETIAPVLEPTEALSQRFNRGSHQWRRFSNKDVMEGKALAPASSQPILLFGSSGMVH